MGYLTEHRSFRPALLSDGGDLLGDMFRSFFVPIAETATRWAPAMELEETSEAYVLRAEVPGIDPAGIQITLTGETLTIQGEKKSEVRDEKNQLHFVERSYGVFERSFTFPAAAEPEGIEAEAKDGVLTVRVRKAKEARPRKVSVKVK